MIRKYPIFQLFLLVLLTGACSTTEKISDGEQLYVGIKSTKYHRETAEAKDITVIDITEVSTIADYFIIATGANPNQLAAMQDIVDETMYKNGVHSKQVEGNSNSTWILMDYQDIIVHLFSSEDRLFYDLERIWRDGKVIDINE